MKKLFGILLIAALAICATGCKNGGKAKWSEPQKIADKAMSALLKGDYEAFAATFNLEEKDQKMLAAMVSEKVGPKFTEKGGLAGYTIGEAHIDDEGTQAEVEVVFKYKDGTEEDQELSFQKDGDTWKQVLDK